MATVSVMRANVRDFADVDVTDVSDAFVTRALDAAYSELIGDASWPFLLARGTLVTTTGVAEYNVVSGVGADCEAHRIRQVQFLGTSLRYIAPEVYYTLNPLGASGGGGGTSQWWAILESSTIALWPPPATGTARIIYVRKPTPLTLDAHVPEAPERYHELLETGALVKVYQKIGDFESAEIKKKEFTDSVNQIHRDLLRTQETSPLVYGGSREPVTLLPPRMPWDELI
jgi:hypothetical protein